jgi:maleylacetoacetate isomerase
MLKLYDYFRSSACFRVRIALNLKGLDYEAIPIHLVNNGGEQHSASYQKINPQNLVPSLQEGNHILTQSLAIIEYLQETYPSPSLLAKNAYHNALIRSFALTIVADIHPLNNLRVLNYLTHEFAISDEQKTIWYHHWLGKGLIALENHLKTHQLSGDFCFGNQPSLADVCLIPQMYNARRFAYDLDSCPTLIKIEKNCQQLSAFIDAYPIEA